MFKQNPHRWIPIYNKDKVLVEVCDTETGNMWYSIGGDRWMYIND
jgi:hypothetical protein